MSSKSSLRFCRVKSWLSAARVSLKPASSVHSNARSQVMTPLTERLLVQNKRDINHGSICWMAHLLTTTKMVGGYDAPEQWNFLWWLSLSSFAFKQHALYGPPHLSWKWYIEEECRAVNYINCGGWNIQRGRLAAKTENTDMSQTQHGRKPVLTLLYWHA